MCTYTHTQALFMHLISLTDRYKGFDKKYDLLLSYLTKVAFKWFEIGVMLGVPIHILEGLEDFEPSRRRIIEIIKVSFTNLLI